MESSSSVSFKKSNSDIPESGSYRNKKSKQNEILKTE